jgi:hypothetical protein
MNSGTSGQGRGGLFPCNVPPAQAYFPRYSDDLTFVRLFHGESESETGEAEFWATSHDSTGYIDYSTARDRFPELKTIWDDLDPSAGISHGTPQDSCERKGCPYYSFLKIFQPEKVEEALYGSPE